MRYQPVILPLLALAGLFASSPALGLIEAGALKPVVEVLKEERYIDGEHPAQDARHQFLVYAKDAQRAQEVLAVVVQRRHQAQQFFQTSVIWREPAVVIVYPNRTAYLRSTGLFGTGGVQMQFRYKGKGVKVKLVITYEGEGMLEHTLPHELMHLLTSDMSNRGYFDGRRSEVTELPIWTNEGIAEYMTADAKRRTDFEKIVYYALHEDAMLGLERLLRQTRYDSRIALHYAESYSLVAFIAATVPDGRQRLRNFIMAFDDPNRAKDPIRTFELTFQGVAPSIDAFEARWHAWIRQQYVHHLPPVVAKTFPGDKSADASAEGKIWIKFDKPMDPQTVSVATVSLRKGSSKELGDDADNLLRGAKLSWGEGGTVLLIEASGGFEAGGTYTLVLSNYVKDLRQHGLVVDKFAAMETDEWWTQSTIEPTPGGQGTTAKKTTAKTPPKAVSVLTFKTKGGESE
ncbi:MAG: Ig-like domain-containing protein [Verrucomicrobia bacterium]|nr:Ig-like domain-containing protein [Verrucomicrobiota bacterium]